MTKILVISENYPDNYGNISMQYVHTRNTTYLMHGIEVDVLNFSTKQSYKIDGVNVFTENDISSYKLNSYKKIISHAPNLKNHVRILSKVNSKENIIMFFHGHEILYKSKHYPRPYEKLSKSKFHSVIINNIYDIYKLKYWKWALNNKFKESTLVFVSEWMLEAFKKDAKIETLNNEYHIIHNMIGKIFQENLIVPKDHDKYKYDVTTIRPFFDFSKYAIDLVSFHAKTNPKLKFHVFGKGRFFDKYERPSNLIVHDTYLNHEQIRKILDDSKIVYLPTRLDAQGVMACEIASYGSKLIVSDIPVSHEMLDEFTNVNFITNDKTIQDFSIKIKEINVMNEKNNKFGFKNTVKKEIDLILK